MNHNTIAVFLSVFAFLSPSLASAQSQQEKTTKQKKRAPNPAMTPVEDIAGLPRVLLIGDSISIGYTAPVRDLLKGKANVHRPLTNCGPTTKGVQEIDKWLGTGKWDVIHFNWGLHDLKYMGPNNENLADPAASDSHRQVPPAEYEKNLRTLVARLKKTGAKLIWRTTTPVPTGAKGRVVGDSERYNMIAQRVMVENHIAVDDQYTFAKPLLADIQLRANVHFTKEGSKRLAEQTAAAIQRALREATAKP